MPDSQRHDETDVILAATGGMPALDTEMDVDAETEIEMAATKKLGIMGWLAIGWLALILVMAIIPGIFPFGELGERDIEALRNDEGVSIAHPFGFDSRGSDLATRVIYGCRASVIVSVGSILFGLVIGGILGLMSGYFRGRLDSVIVNVFNVMLAIPALVLALTLATVFASGDNVSYTRRLVVVTLAIGIVSVPILGRITRASTLTWSEREFVIAAKAMGARSHRIIIREVLPNVLPAMFSITLLGMAIAIITEGGLAVIGVGIPAELNTPSWGNLIATGRSQMLLGAPNQIVGPALFIFFTVLSLNYLGDV
ncbi:MAG TPA: ABC transporter permease, partial [Acidimicrobiales bacterium]|nr:ABC transporter permease [Acidimicrobiales bacterium]